MDFFKISLKVIFAKDFPVNFTGISLVNFKGNSFVKLKAISIKGISFVKLSIKSIFEKNTKASQGSSALRSFYWDIFQ